jgi:hypothetical protein
MLSFGMLNLMALVRTDALEERIDSIISVTRIGELGTILAVTSKLADSCHPDDGGETFLRNVGCYKSHMAQHPRRRNYLIFTSSDGRK